jgi:hypothetical protein
MKYEAHFGASRVVGEVPETYRDADAKYQDHLLEQYKLFVDKTHGYWKQFLSANEFFLKINTLVLSVFAWLVTAKVQIPIPLLLILVVLALLLVAHWFLAIRSLRQLNGVRHEIIQEWENYLPAQPYKCEYEKLYAVKRRYRRFQQLYLVLCPSLLELPISLSPQ